MTFLHKITQKFYRNNSQNASGINPSVISQQPIVLKQAAKPSKPKTLAELEQSTYETNLGQVKVRRQAEADSVQAFFMAQREIESLMASIPTDPKNLDRNRVISQLHSIINQLEKVEKGTTVYLKAQELLLSANNKFKQLQ